MKEQPEEPIATTPTPRKELLVSLAAKKPINEIIRPYYEGGYRFSPYYKELLGESYLCIYHVNMLVRVIPYQEWWDAIDPYYPTFSSKTGKLIDCGVKLGWMGQRYKYFAVP